MKKQPSTPYTIGSVSALHKLLNLPKPAHPLVSVIDLATVDTATPLQHSLTYEFYSIALKKDFQGKIKYGQQYYDFDEGVMTFIAPKQVFTVDPDNPPCNTGFMLIVHPDFFQTYPLAAKIKEYGFFSYAVYEALHPSASEEQLVYETVRNIEREISHSIDQFTQDVIISHIELLLNYCNRFYHRQFITRKLTNNSILSRMEQVLQAYFNSDQLAADGPPTVQYVATQLNLSANYLSDMLRAHTGLSTKQHIQNSLIDKAKEMLSTTPLSISEVAYQLGFPYPQSFNKAFKNSTNLSPLAYRKSLN